jgi:hypothetical protein
MEKLKNNPEYLFLYKMTHDKKLDYNLNRVLTETVRKIRLETRTVNDLLREKETRYGNDGEWGKNKIYSLEQKIYKTKLPTNDASLIGKYISVEIECVFPSNNDLKNFCKAIRANKLVDSVCVKNDGSIQARRQVSDDDDSDGEPDGDYVGKEIVVTFISFDTLKSVCDILLQHGAFVNKSCGLHVHFDMRQFTNKRSITVLGQRLAKCVPAFKLMLPTSRRDNHYCQAAISFGNNRYAAINLTSFKKHGTLEIRLHSGTIDSTKIINWINICSAAMQCKELSKRDATDITGIEELIYKLKLQGSLASYVKERYNKFNPQVLSTNNAA